MRKFVSRAAWLGVALLSLALSGCASAAHASGPAAPRATATATPLPQLVWTPVKLPADFSGDGNNLAVSPVDGHDAWMCQSTSANTYAIWKTTDAGATWSQVGHFSFTAPLLGAWCDLNADQNGTSALLATIGWGCGECGNLAGASLFSADGATHWTPLSGYVGGGEFASVSGGVIAIMAKSADGQSGGTEYLAFSSNGFQTWRAMSSRGLPTQFFHFAVSPDGATLIGSGYNDTLWRSSDLGAHWTQISSPSGQQTGLNIWLPQRQAFLLCGNNLQPQGLIYCSTDLGAHWYPVHTLAYSAPCPTPGKCGQGVTTQRQQCVPTGVESDGTIISLCLPNQTTPLPPSGPSSSIVYRYPLGGSAWQQIGSTQCALRAIPASGPVWCADATPDQLTGYETGQLPG